ncbi:MAG: hypothetical protein KGQ36_05275 [Rickettsiales bacterium]|nr:hypothetical protein [Rickettsiales bacterium]
MIYHRIIIKLLLTISLLLTTSCVYFNKEKRLKLLKEKAFTICRSVNWNGEKNNEDYFLKSENYFKVRDKAVELNSSLEKTFTECDKLFLANNRNITETNQIAINQGFENMINEMRCPLIVEIKDKMLSSNYHFAEEVLETHFKARNNIIKTSGTTTISGLLLKYKSTPQDVKNQINQCVTDFDNISKEVKNYKNKIIDIKNNNLATAKAHGYKEMWIEQGLSGIIYAVSIGDLKIKEAQEFLIEKNISLDSSITVEEIIGNMVVYSNEPNDLFNHHIRFAMPRDKTEFYGKKSALNGNHFAITKNQTFKIEGKNIDLLVLKKVNIHAALKKNIKVKKSKIKSKKTNQSPS